jgi:hypothetical protein
MDDRRRTLAALTVIIVGIVFVVIFIGVLLSGKKVLSPVPEDSAIKIIFVSPSPIQTITSTESPSPSSKPTSTPKP